MFTVVRGVEVENFAHHLDNRKLLFHGSKISNWVPDISFDVKVGILSRGLLIPRMTTDRTDLGMLGKETPQLISRLWNLLRFRFLCKVVQAGF